MAHPWFSSNRVTPEAANSQSGVERMDDRVGLTTHQGWLHELKKDVFVAMKNKHQQKIDKHPPKNTDPAWRKGDIIEVMGNEPSVVTDYNGYPVAWVFPMFMK
ncbi:hypothetical protein FRC10_009483 [Ceratobasidium sp. 414]|nr:hypothetical protein FRC10_009483 [Ceratobasidium sp. 414]